MEVSDKRNRPFYWIETVAFEILARISQDVQASEFPHRRRIGPLVHAVYHALCRYVNSRSGKAWPHVRTISSQVGAGRSQVFEAFAVLEDYYLIRRESGKDRGKGNVYEVLDAEQARILLQEHGPGKRFRTPEAPAEGRRDERGEGVSTARMGGVHGADGGVHGADAHPNPLFSKGLASESAQTAELPTVSVRPGRPSNRRKSKPASAQQDPTTRRGKNRAPAAAGRPGSSSPRRSEPVPIRNILGNIGGELQRRRRELIEAITQWLTDPAYPHGKARSTPASKVAGQVGSALNRIGYDSMLRIFDHWARGAKPSAVRFWETVNATATV